MFELFPYQEVGADYLAARARAGLFDLMGIGKSAQAIGALDRTGAKRVLIVCPAAVREVWIGEFKRFARVKRRVLKCNTIHDLGYWLKGKADVLVISYERATIWHKHLQGDFIDAIIFDEAHYLKSSTAKRTRHMLGTHCQGESGVARWGARVWMLTGTPVPNDPIDIWPFLRFTGATTLNMAPFVARYFKVRATSFGTRQKMRDETAAELRDVVNAYSLRRTHEDVGNDIPPIFLTTVSIDGDTSEIMALLREHEGLEAAILDAVEQGGLSFLDAQHIGTLRRLVGEAKAPAYAAMLIEEFHNGRGKTVIGGIHTEALATIKEALEAAGIKTVMVVGSTPETQRVEAVRAFQNDADCMAFVGNLRAAGTGLTLIAAADIDIFESSWAPADNAQFLYRVRRIGQTRNVRGRFIELANSIDQRVTTTVVEKTAAIAKLEITQGEAA